MPVPSARVGFTVARQGPILLAGFRMAEGAGDRPLKEFRFAVGETEHEVYSGGPAIEAWTAAAGKPPARGAPVAHGQLQ